MNIYTGVSAESVYAYLQGLVQSGFLWGYMATQMIGGSLADKYGGSLHFYILITLPKLSAQAIALSMGRAHDLANAALALVMQTMDQLCAQWLCKLLACSISHNAVCPPAIAWINADRTRATYT